MAPEVTAYPNGHDSTGMPEESLRQPTPRRGETQSADADWSHAPFDIQIIRAGGVSSPVVELPEAQPIPEQLPVRRITTEELYSRFENVSPELNSAVRLLSRCLEYVDQALQAHRENDPIEADDATQRMQGLLPELFCCRSLGDGFGIVVNGLMCAFQNLAGIPLRREQIEKVRQILLSLRTEPFLRDEDAVKAITSLEDLGLRVEPAEFDYLTDLLDE